MCKMHSFLYLKCLVLVGVYISEVSAGTVSRIVGGLDAPERYGLFHASLQNATGHHVCGGAIVSERQVLTAAHCVQGAAPQYIKVVVGTTNLDAGGISFDVVSILVHENYNASTRSNDIALLTVKASFKSDCVRILELNENELAEGDILTLTGFGAVLPNGESSRHMHKLVLPVFNQETCQYAMRYSKDVLDSMFCTFTHVGEGTCHGDSGGPLIKDNKLVGLVSWGIPCAVGFPDVHTRITSYIDWIRKHIRVKQCIARSVRNSRSKSLK